MAFSNGSGDRFASIPSPRDDAPSYTSYSSSPFRPMMPTTTATTTSHERASLQRRFTTNAVPTVPTLGTMTPLSPIGLQRRQAAEQADYTSAVRVLLCPLQYLVAMLLWMGYASIRVLIHTYDDSLCQHHSGANITRRLYRRHYTPYTRFQLYSHPLSFGP